MSCPVDSAALDHDEKALIGVGGRFEVVEGEGGDGIKTRAVGRFCVNGERHGILAGAPPDAARGGTKRGRIALERGKTFGAAVDPIALSGGFFVQVARVAGQVCAGICAGEPAAHEKIKAAIDQIEPDFVEHRAVGAVGVESGGGSVVYRDARDDADLLAAVAG